MNIASFFDRAFIGEVTRTIRDNRSPGDAYAIRDASGNGGIQTIQTGGGYRWAAGDNVWNEGKFREKFAKTLGSLRDVREIRHKNSKVGYRAVGSDLKSGATCVVAETAYNLLDMSVRDFSTDAFDTGVVLWFCSSNPDPTKFDRMLAELDVVHDRGAYRAALQAR